MESEGTVEAFLLPTETALITLLYGREWLVGWVGGCTGQGSHARPWSKIARIARVYVWVYACTSKHFYFVFQNRLQGTALQCVAHSATSSSEQSCWLPPRCCRQSAQTIVAWGNVRCEHAETQQQTLLPVCVHFESSGK